MVQPLFHILITILLWELPEVNGQSSSNEAIAIKTSDMRVDDAPADRPLLFLAQQRIKKSSGPELGLLTLVYIMFEVGDLALLFFVLLSQARHFSFKLIKFGFSYF